VIDVDAMVRRFRQETPEVKSVAAKSTVKSKVKTKSGAKASSTKVAVAKPAVRKASAKAPVGGKPKAKAKAVAPARAPTVKAKTVTARTAAAKTTAINKRAPVVAKKKTAATKPVAPKVLPTPIGMVHPTPVVIRKNPRLANNWKTKPVALWTDAEVIAMPDSEYMNEPQMAFFRLKLVGLKNDILANAGQTAENLRDDTVVVPDPADRATIEEEHALELRTRDRERKLLKKIEQSIARIDAGDYGYCDETGEPIGVPRLLARPTATLSLEAQQRRELKQKMFGD
jgi:DnaK suppressor protein